MLVRKYIAIEAILSDTRVCVSDVELHINVEWAECNICGDTKLKFAKCESCLGNLEEYHICGTDLA